MFYVSVTFHPRLAVNSWIFFRATSFPPCFVALSGTFSSAAAAFSPGNVALSGIFSLPAGIGRIFAGKNISLTLWGIKQDFFNEDI